MKSLALSLLLAMGRPASAGLPSVVIDVPLTPASAPAYEATAGAISLSAAPRFLGAVPAPAPTLALAAVPAASIALTPAEASAAPAPAAFAAAQPAAAAPQFPNGFAPALAHSPAASVPDGPRAIDALRANAPLADELSASANSDAPENSARALEGNFNAAASLGDRERALRLEAHAGDEVRRNRDAFVQVLDPIQHGLQPAALRSRNDVAQPFLLGKSISQGPVASQFGNAKRALEFIVLGVEEG